MLVIAERPQSQAVKLLTGCVNGYGKRTPLEDYPVKGRGTRGVINIDANDRNGDVVGMNARLDDDELMLITRKASSSARASREIRETGRNAAGVRLIKLDEGDDSWRWPRWTRRMKIRLKNPRHHHRRLRVRVTVKTHELDSSAACGFPIRSANSLT